MFKTQQRPAQIEFYVEKKTTAPTVTDDTAAGFKVGDRWLETTTPVSYELLDATNNAAVWQATAVASPDLGLHTVWDGDGPVDGFASGFLEVTGQPFPTLVIWYIDATKAKKVVEKIIIRNDNQTPATIVWKQYAGDGITVTKTVTDTITYLGVLEISRTRTIA